MTITTDSLVDVALSLMVWWAIGYGVGLLNRVIRQLMEKFQ